MGKPSGSGKFIVKDKSILDSSLVPPAGGSRSVDSMPDVVAHRVGITAVERDTGIGKDTLRVWERRYGFPQPFRDTHGERMYPMQQVARLRLIKRLLDQGFRPGKLLSLPLEQLDVLLGQSIENDSQPHPIDKKSALVIRQAAGQTGGKSKGKSSANDAVSGSIANSATDWIIPLLKNHDISLLRTTLAQRMAQSGPMGFVLDVLPSLNVRVGNAWLRGELAVFEEHVYTEVVQNVLRTTLQSLSLTQSLPRVLLTTVKNEQHGLGLMMAEICLAVDGATCISMGVQTPVADIVLAAKHKAMDIVALSFSAAYSWRHIHDCLLELRAQLPANIALWAGGAGVAGRTSIAGITLMSDLRAIHPALAAWRTGNQRA